MSIENSKKNSFRETSIGKNRPGFKLHNVEVENFRSCRKLPFIKERKYSSTKNLVISSTCDIGSTADETKHVYLTKLRRKIAKKDEERNLAVTSAEPSQIKQFFQKRKHIVNPLENTQMKKYFSYNKLTSFPSIPEIQAQNDESFHVNEAIEQERQIKSSNSIKLQTIQYVKKPKMERIPLKKIMKACNKLSKTINPRKVDSEHSIELQPEQKALITRKRPIGQLQKFQSRTKILVKNPFNKLPKKHSTINQNDYRYRNQQKDTKPPIFDSNHQTLPLRTQQWRLSKIFQDTNNQSDMSISGKSDIENLIAFMH